MKIKSNFLGIIILVIVFGGIFSTSLFNLWRTESSKIPRTITSGEFKGSYDPDDIRGSYSFNDISELFNIPLEDLRVAFSIPEDIDVTNFKNKDLESLYSNLKTEGKEIGNNSVKLFVAFYSGIYFETKEDIYLPKSALEILKEKNKLSEEQIQYLNSHIVDINEFDSVITSENREEHNENEIIIKGNTTFKELLEFGLEVNKIEEILGMRLPNPIITVRDFCIENGLAFGDIKNLIQIELDKL